jgi:methionine synthase II (cobalamin-independent)
MNKYFECVDCKGQGYFEDIELYESMGLRDSIECKTCKGTGYIPLENMVMEIVGSIHKAWKSLQESKIKVTPLDFVSYSESKHNKKESYVNLFSWSAGHHLAEATLMLKELKDVCNIRELLPYGFSDEKFLLSLISLLSEYKGMKDYLRKNYFDAIFLGIQSYAESNRIDLDKHIEVLKEYRA